MTKGRRRSKANFPAHIDKDKLPKGVIFESKGNGFFRIQVIDPDTGKRSYKRLCGADATLNQIWQLAEIKEETKPLCFELLSNDFQASPDWRKLVKTTQDDYEHCHRHICATKTKSGALFGTTPISHWTIGTVLKYRDHRGEESPSRANKELAYIKRVLAWAKLYEKIGSNVANGVPRLTVAPRQHYAEDKDFYFLLDIAKQSAYWYMPYLLIISYECALRLCEAVELNDARELPNGLKIVGRKGSRTNIIEWGDTLKTAWDEAKAKRNAIYAKKSMALPFRPEDRYLFISDKTGDRLKERAIKTAKNRLDNLAKAKAARIGFDYRPFTLHDIKKKGISDDMSANKQDKSRHKTKAMVELYDLSVKTVKPTSDS